MNRRIDRRYRVELDAAWTEALSRHADYIQHKHHVTRSVALHMAGSWVTSPRNSTVAAIVTESVRLNARQP